MGHKGSFTYAGNRVHVFDTSSPYGEYAIKIKNDSITITSGDGYKYIFGPSTKRAKQYKKVTRSLAGGTGRSFASPIGVESWVLSKITAPNAREVKFSYDSSAGETANFRPGEESISWGPLSTGHVDKKLDFHYVEYLCEVPQIKCISIGLVRINFEYGDRINETHLVDLVPADLATLKKLELIKVVKGATALKECVLSYEYASEQGNQVMFLDKVNLSGEGEYSMSYLNQHDVFPHHGTVSIDHWGYYNSEPDYDLVNIIPIIVCDTNNFVKQTFVGPLRTPNAIYAKKGMLSRITYPTGGSTEFEYEPHRYVDFVARYKEGLFASNLPYWKRGYVDSQTGGVRISKIIDISRTNSRKTKTYNYGNGLACTGTLHHMPIYLSIYKIFYRDIYLEGSKPAPHLLRTLSASDLSTYHIDKSHIGYSEVSEVCDDGSKTIYKFADYQSFPDTFYAGGEGYFHPLVKFENEILMNEFMSIPDYVPPFRGKLLSTLYCNANGVPIKKISNIYNTDYQRDFLESGVYSADAFYVHRTYLQSYPLIKTEINEYINAQDITKTIASEIQYYHNELGQVIRTEQTNSDDSKVSDIVTYVKDIMVPLRTPIQQKMVTRNVVNMPIMTSKTISHKTGNSYGDEKLLAADKYDYVDVSNKIIKLGQHSRARIALHANVPHITTYYREALYELYDNKGRPLKVTDRYGVVTEYTWGENQLYPETVTIGGVLHTAYEYNIANGIVRLVDPSGRMFSYLYDTKWRLICELDERMNPIVGYQYSTATAPTKLRP